MSFCTVVNCMDGRVQLPVIRYLKKQFGALYVDTVTEPGPSRVLAEGDDRGAVESILRRVRISLEKHGSRQIAVVAHEDCAGNPTDKRTQVQHLRAAAGFLRDAFPGTAVRALWVNLDGDIQEPEASSGRVRERPYETVAAGRITEWTAPGRS